MKGERCYIFTIVWKLNKIPVKASDVPLKETSDFVDAMTLKTEVTYLGCI